MTKQTEKRIKNFIEEVKNSYTAYNGSLCCFSEANAEIDGYIEALADVGLITYLEKIHISYEVYEYLETIK